MRRVNRTRFSCYSIPGWLTLMGQHTRRPRPHTRSSHPRVAIGITRPLFSSVLVQKVIDMTLVESLRQASDRILLRVADSRGARVVHEFTGKHLLDSEKIVRLQPISRDSRVSRSIARGIVELLGVGWRKSDG
jgi:hypothetical protein